MTDTTIVPKGSKAKSTTSAPTRVRLAAFTDGAEGIRPLMLDHEKPVPIVQIQSGASSAPRSCDFFVSGQKGWWPGIPAPGHLVPSYSPRDHASPSVTVAKSGRWGKHSPSSCAEPPMTR